MANVAIFNTQTNAVISYLESVNTTDYQGRPDVILNPDLSQVAAIPVRYWKHQSGGLVAMTAQEQSDVDAAIAAAATSSMRTTGKDLLSASDQNGILFRAVADITKDEINILRQWIVDFKADVAAATNLADLKTRVAADPDLPDRTLSQLRTAIRNRIDSGDVDA